MTQTTILISHAKNDFQLTKEKRNVNDIIALDSSIGLVISGLRFTVVNKLHKSDPPKLDLLREGFPNAENHYLVDGITFGSKCVKYEG